MTIRPPEYHVDIVLCIDKTGNMTYLLWELKQNAAKLYDKIIGKFDEEFKTPPKKIRVKVIAFGDYAFDEHPMQISRFYLLPEENDDLEAFINNIDGGGGGDSPENALEALAHAIKSDWTEDGGIRRHEIVLITNSSALELGIRTNLSNDDEQIAMPSDLRELNEWWDSMNHITKRFALIAPGVYPWDFMSIGWDNTVYIPVTAGLLCEEIDIDELIKIIYRTFDYCG